MNDITSVVLVSVASSAGVVVALLVVLVMWARDRAHMRVLEQQQTPDLEVWQETWKGTLEAWNTNQRAMQDTWNKSWSSALGEFQASLRDVAEKFKFVIEYNQSRRDDEDTKVVETVHHMRDGLKSSLEAMQMEVRRRSDHDTRLLNALEQIAAASREQLTQTGLIDIIRPELDITAAEIVRRTQTHTTDTAIATRQTLLSALEEVVPPPSPPLRRGDTKPLDPAQLKGQQDET